MTIKSNPPVKHAPITASADALTIACTGIYVGGTGNITATLDGVSVTYNNVQAGSILPGEFTHVTASTATGLIAVGQ